MSNLLRSHRHKELQEGTLTDQVRAIPTSVGNLQNAVKCPEAHRLAGKFQDAKLLGDPK